MSWEQFIWQPRTWRHHALLPAAWAYRFGHTVTRYVRRQYATEFPVPVVVVGNITVGGSGKTPFVIYLVNLLTQWGWRPGVVSRGYGGRATGYPLLVTKTSDPAIVGDEPVLIARHCDAPVMVDPKRVRAISALLTQHNCDVIVSDDGLQHYAMQRDIEIVVIDGKRRFGNGLHLPAGPLREPVSRLHHVDFLVTNGEAQAGEFAMTLVAGPLLNVRDPTQCCSLKDCVEKKVHAIAGIGHPDQFFASLRAHGLSLTTRVFPDHHAFLPKDLASIDADMVIMTEKDAVKCQAFAQPNWWYLPISAVLPDQFQQAMARSLKALTE